MYTSTLYRLLLIFCSLFLPLSRTSGVNCIALLFSPSTSIPNISIIVIIAVSCPRIFSPNKNILINRKRNINSAGRSIYIMIRSSIEIFQGIARKKKKEKIVYYFIVNICILLAKGLSGSESVECKEIGKKWHQ